MIEGAVVPESSRSSRKVAGLIADIGLVLLGIAALALYSSWGRPIWVDENLHFSLGDMDFQGVLTVIHKTTTEINHGQTGAYMLADWLLLKVFGASSFALRLPSLLAGALLLFSAVMVIRLRGFARPWQYLMVGFMACQGFLMYFVGEARPYIVLAATAVATLAYYLLEPSRRRGWLGWALLLGGVVLGVINHPYYPLTLAIALVIGLWVGYRSGWLTRGWRSAVTFVDAPLLVVAGVLYLLIGALTWLRGKPDFGYDPYSNMGGREAVVSAFWHDHFGLLWGYQGWAVLFVIVIVVALALNRFRGLLDLVAPVALGVMAFCASVAVSLASYMSNYWILERQWVAGIALLAVAVVWLVAQVLSSASGLNRWVAVLPGLAVAWVVVLGAWSVYSSQTATLAGYSEQQVGFASETRTVEQMVADQVDWVTIANVNIDRGGPVWPVFTEWYGRQAGMREEG